MGEKIGAKVRDNPFAERHHQVVSRARSQREHRNDADHRQKIRADQAGVGIGETKVDHTPNGDRHDQSGGRRNRQRDQSQPDPAAMGQGVRRKRLQGAERRAGLLAADIGGG